MVVSEVLAKVSYPFSHALYPNDFGIGAVAPSFYEKSDRETDFSCVSMVT